MNGVWQYAHKQTLTIKFVTLFLQQLNPLRRCTVNRSRAPVERNPIEGIVDFVDRMSYVFHRHFGVIMDQLTVVERTGSQESVPFLIPFDKAEYESAAVFETVYFQTFKLYMLSLIEEGLPVGYVWLRRPKHPANKKFRDE